MLNEQFPTRNGIPIQWDESDFHVAQGAWRKKSMDVWSWNAYAVYKDTGGTAMAVGSYTTVTELIKCKRLVIGDDGEVYGENDEKPEDKPAPKYGSDDCTCDQCIPWNN